jgi:chromosome segregation ATPase
MKPRGQIVAGDGFDGFDKNVAEKMPKIRKEEEPPLSVPEEQPQPILKVSPEMTSPKKASEREAIFAPPSRAGEEEENRDVLKLIEDLHAQLLVSNRTKRTLEIDLSSSQKTIRQLAQENDALGIQVDGLRKELQKFEEFRSEFAYLEEENEDALERIMTIQGETKALREVLAKATRERDQALAQIQTLEAKIEENDLLRIKGKLKEREVSHFSEENEELRTRLEEALAQNGDLEGKYEALKKSFHEVKESLTLLRDACKTSYYNLSDSPKQDPGN